jgi:hypothetical protein
MRPKGSWKAHAHGGTDIAVPIVQAGLQARCRGWASTTLMWSKRACSPYQPQARLTKVAASTKGAALGFMQLAAVIQTHKMPPFMIDV